ncbi:MAG: glycosyltransferase family 39 protein [Deltaproteobacteria bacterium]|nr:glycosyltransferase family 39 protein [Deltaproteobacteria bacterium]
MRIWPPDGAWGRAEMLNELLASRRARAVIPVVLLAVFVSQASYIAWEKSSTWDEPTHLMSGYARLMGGDTRASMHHPALGQEMIAAPAAVFLALAFDKTINPSYPNGRFFVSSVKFLYENRVDARTLLFLARLPNIILGAILGLYVFLWSESLWGASGAYLSLFFYSLSPDVLAHASLATTDLSAAAFIFIAAFYLYRIYDRGADSAGALAAGVGIGLALSAKHTAVILAPFVLVTFAMRLKKDGARKTAVAFLYLSAAAYLVVWAVYGFRYQASVAPLPWDGFPPSALKAIFSLLKEIKFLPEAHLYSLAGTFAAGASGGAGFLMGGYSGTGWWYYFITAFLIKTPVPTIFLVIAALLYGCRSSNSRGRAFALFLPVAVIFLLASLQKVNIGIRHILPVYPFLFTLIGFVPSIKTGSVRPARHVFGAACVWYLYAAVSIFPHDLAYFNEFIGGPANGYKYLVDSNLDWGQDLRGLKEFMDANGIKNIKLAYFGLGDPRYYGIDYDYMPSYVIPEPGNVRADIVLKGWFAVSATMLQGVYLPQRDFYRPFRETEPVAMIGYSIFVYRFD